MHDGSTCESTVPIPHSINVNQTRNPAMPVATSANTPLGGPIGTELCGGGGKYNYVYFLKINLDVNLMPGYSDLHPWIQ